MVINERYGRRAWCGLLNTVTLLIVVALWVGCGAATPTKVAPVSKTAEDYKTGCEGGDLTSCFIAHESFVDRCRTAHDGWACYHAGLYWERGLGVVPNREAAVAAFANACTYGYDDACTHELQMHDTCWMGKACRDRCISERSECDALGP